jgi:hypothetical protein
MEALPVSNKTKNICRGLFQDVKKIKGDYKKNF